MAWRQLTNRIKGRRFYPGPDTEVVQMSQDDAHNVLSRLAHEHGVNLSEVPVPVMNLMRTLVEGYLDGKRMATALSAEDTDRRPTHPVGP